MALSPLLFVWTLPLLAGVPAEQPAITEVAAESSEVAAAPSGADAQVAEDAVTIEELRRFALVFREVQRSYVEPVTERQLMEAAIRGLLGRLDPHSTYLDQAQLGQLNEDATGSYAGLGLEVQVRDGALRIVAAIDDTPAAQAGLKTGDVIARIDGAPLEGEALYDAVDSMRGDPGSQVTLTILRDGADPFEVTLTRELVRVDSVRARWLDPGIAYLRIATFQADTAASLNRQLDLLGKQQAPRGLVLDLRSNPGGLLQAAVAVVDAFVEKGAIVSTRGRQPVASMSFSASPGDLLKGAPIVVLIDNGSASASEIVAGALQDLDRALVVGQRSFGKGSVQSILPLANGDGVKLTTARYYTPDDRSIQAEGIVPDIELPDAEFRRSAGGLRRTTEADLRNHLGNAGAGAAAAKPAAPAIEGPGDDYALTEATHILKALIAQRKS